MLLLKVFVKIFKLIEASFEVNHRTFVAVFVYKLQCGNACFLCHESIICTKSRGNVNNTCTVLCAYVIAKYYAECALTRVYISKKLFVFQPFKVCAFEVRNNPVG